MATVKTKNSEVAIIQPVTPKVARNGKRGPKYKKLPLTEIKRWATGGMGSKAISRKLAKDYGINVGFRTVARVLSGERLMV